MKTLSPEQMISLAPLTPAQLQVGEMLMARVMPEFDNAEAQLHYEVAEGYLQTAGIQFDGQAHFAVFYHIAPGKILYINGVQRLRKDCKSAVAIDGLKMLAEKLGCKMISGTVRRAGFIRELLRDGYQAFGVVVLKKLEAKG